MSEPIVTAPPANAAGGTRRKGSRDAGSAQERPTIVLDFGSKSARKIKRLRKGRGPLMERVHDAVQEIADDPTLSAASPVVVVVVKKRKKSRGLFS